MAADGSRTDEYVTLVNPRRDVGAAYVHGIAQQDVDAAPTFDEIARRCPFQHKLATCCAAAGLTQERVHEAREDASVPTRLRLRRPAPWRKKETPAPGALPPS
jgi:hypothetical protein